MKVKVYNIVWATDCHDAELLNLPSETGVELDCEDSEEEVANALFCTFGWPTDHFDYEEWDS